MADRNNDLSVSAMSESTETSAPPNLTTSPSPHPKDHVLRIDGSTSSIDLSHPKKPNIFDLKPPPLLDDPDDKDKFGSRDSPNFIKVIRYVFISNVQPWRPMIAVILWSAAAVGISTAAAQSFPLQKRNNCRYMCSPLAFDNTVAAYVGLALFLLIGFRVNEAYGRYERGLEIWNETIATIVSSFATHAGRIFPEGLWHPGDRKRLFGWLAAFPVTLKRKLRGERDVSELRSVLADDDLDKLKAAENMPSYCLGILNTYIMEATSKQEQFPQVFIHRMLAYTGKLSLAMNKCENIAQYSVNYGYLAHLRLFMGIWLFLLPFSLVQDAGWYTVLITPFVAYGILGMEKIAEELTQPFGYDFNDIPIGHICNQIIQGIRSKYKLANSPIPTLLYECETPDPMDFM